MTTPIYQREYIDLAKASYDEIQVELDEISEELEALEAKMTTYTGCKKCRKWKAMDADRKSLQLYYARLIQAQMVSQIIKVNKGL